ncbi:hypothetical protein EON77_12705 [bacterium]|nr:MAG: hypothetical protein EON77_12705 [bacterium]
MLPFVVPLALAAPVLSRDVGGWRLLTQARGTLRVRPMRTTGGRVQVSHPIAARTFPFGREGQPPGSGHLIDGTIGGDLGRP